MFNGVAATAFNLSLLAAFEVFDAGTLLAGLFSLGVTGEVMFLLISRSYSMLLTDVAFV